MLAVTDAGVATSSTQISRWTIDDELVHHLIDPRTGQPGGAGLAAVTVVGPDTAQAEVWSKVLFLAGAAGIESAAHREDLAAMWIDTSGVVAMTPAMDPYVVWTRP